MVNTTLIEIIEDYVGKIKFPCIEEVSLYHDLNIYGDDADELLTKYSQRFNVSVKNFPFSDYFPYEGDLVLPSILRFITGKKEKKYKRLTIGDLQHAINKGTLMGI